MKKSKLKCFCIYAADTISRQHLHDQKYLQWMHARQFWMLYYRLLIFCLTLNCSNRGRLDLAVLFIVSTPNRQNRNQVCWNICAGVHRILVLHLPRWCRQNSYVTCSKTGWRSTACMCENLCISWFIPVPSFTCFRWLFWHTRSTLKLLNQVRPSSLRKTILQLNKPD